MKILGLRSKRGTRSSGFGLIEILVTLGILSVGILGVATLHSVITRQSADNKARAEAMEIAQSRLEQMRNYTDAAGTTAEFNTLFANLSNGNSTTINGISATFTRTETITTSGSNKNITVMVGWTDPGNAAQNVSLATSISFLAPRSAGDTALEGVEELVDAPTGRARLGDGTLTEAQLDAAISNGDGTSEVISGLNRLLAVDSNVVLTLVEACQTEGGSCSDFVRINGRIWIDQATASSIDPGEVYIAASDAAFCARHYTSGSTTTPVTNNTTSTVMTASNNYEYFDYTCYLGGGWHGNIGVFYGGGLTDADSFCVGDPTSSINNEKPVIAARRSYRGMLYKIDNSEDDGMQKVYGTDEVRYYSYGIADSAVLPDPDSSDATHDFVVTSNATPTSCKNTIMARADSASGTLFEGVPSDFYCLNDGLLDVYDESEYGHETSCPYDPTNPPVESHIISGTISVSGTDNNDNEDIVAATVAYTSDNVNNCYRTDFSYSGSSYSSNYVCRVYDWGSGWTGNIGLLTSGMTCASDTLSFTSLGQNDTSGNGFTCTIGGGSPDPDPDPTPKYIYFSGTWTNLGTGARALQTATLSDGGSCTVQSNGAWLCTTLGFQGTWTGSITFTSSSNAVICTAASTGNSTLTHSYTNEGEGTKSISLIIRNRNTNCTASDANGLNW
jgi:Tfp pilus assembly protein PilV